MENGCVMFVSVPQYISAGKLTFLKVGDLVERKKKHHLYLENNISFRKCEIVDSVNTGPGSS